MNFFQIVLKSLIRHRNSTLLAAFSIAAGAALLTATFSLSSQAEKAFAADNLGVDAVLGPKGSPLQITLNALFHLEEMPGKIKWTYYKKVLKHPLVEQGIPFISGHSYGGFRVNAVGDDFFTKFEYQPGQRFSFEAADGGSGHLSETKSEAVAGAEAAKLLGIKLGDTFNPTCGVNAGDPVHKHDFIKFVGIMAPTGTAHDRAIFIPLKSFYSLEGHGSAVQEMADDEDSREISGAYLKLKHIRRGALHPGIQELKYDINQSQGAQLVIPAEVLPRLYKIIGWADTLISGIALMVLGLSCIFLFSSLMAALRERRRDIALFRCLGATRRTVFGLMLTESALTSLFGALAGLIPGHILVAVAAHYIKIESGLHFSPLFISPADLWMIPIALLLGILIGFLPAFQAYRLGALTNINKEN